MHVPLFITKKTSFCFVLTLIFICQVRAQQLPVKMQYTVSMERAADQLYHVELTCRVKAKTLDFKMCAWTPGYYQIMDFRKKMVRSSGYRAGYCPPSKTYLQG
jgi:hypothetical protein